MSKSISFDIDGCLYNFVQPAYDYAIENNYTIKSIEYFFSHEEEHSTIFWSNIVRIPMIYYKTSMKKSYKDLLNKLASSGWTIYYLTNRPEEVRVTTYNWLEDSGAPFLENLYFVDKKSDIIRLKNIDYHIDDRSHCIEDVKNFCPSFLINNYWNLNYEEPANCKRLNSILELEGELL